MTYERIPTVLEACELHPSALDFAMSDQVEHLSDLLDDTEKKASDFFAKNYVTAGMARLLREGLQRLDGQSNQAVFELRQAMGGGKTHSMLALGTLARNPHFYDQVPDNLTRGISPLTAKVVAINGRTVSKDHYLWGDIAEQLGGLDQFSKFWKNGADAPSEQDWVDLIGDASTLILLDELPPYFDYAITRPVGGGTLANVATYALSNLLSAAMKLPKTAIVVSNLTGSYQGATQSLAKAIKDISEETKRQARSITPVDLNTNEIYEILRKRMFTKLPDETEIEKVADAFGKSINEAVRSKTIAKSPEQIADEVIGSYPFHPSVKHIIALFKENENYRQTRGLMQFISKMLKSVWDGNPGDVYLIGCQHLDLTMQDVRDEINRIGQLEGALATDVSASDGSAHAETVDANKGSNAATMAAKLLLTASLSENVDSVKGMNMSTLIEYLVAPDRRAVEFKEAFEELRKECWYLHRKENDAWYFSNVENLRKRIENRAANAPQPKIDAELKRRLENAFEVKARRAYGQVIALPLVNEVDLSTTNRICLVMSPDSKTPPQDAQRFLESQVYKNGFCVVTGDGSSMGSLEDKARRIWAIARVEQELSDNPAYRQELQEEAEQAEFDFNASVQSLFNRVYFPMMRDGNTKLVHTKLNLAIEKRNDKNEINGEKAIEDALVGSGANKLITEVKEHFERLVDRAEDVLFPMNQTRARWRDIVERSYSNARWLWVPPKALEEIRDQAVAIGRWSYDADGYVDNRPPKPKTSVNVTVLSYDEETGEAELELFPQNAGKAPLIYMAETPDIDNEKNHLSTTRLTTSSTKLWFLSKDPNGQHETGDPVVWNNRLTLTYQPQYLPNKRIVELTVVPRGEIRWNMSGANPKEGDIYNGPIEIEGSDEVTIYAYAEDKGVSVQKNFKIHKSDSPRQIEKDEPAVLRKTLTGDGIKASFELLKAAKANNDARLQEVSLTVGSGVESVRTRFGSGTAVTADIVEEAIEWARKAIGNNAADIQVSIKGVEFATGFDLEEFAKVLGEDIKPQEVEQE
ncbi:anti-phage-associated DUF499 domain-containing protein [Accumulibacter sp.]|uniref:anti-phage-associated DUF499 domain-containing protein n=1 Tax=Accumulibacter sp. TaxID=2053492 RepID=UPI002A6BC47A|nr:ATP-binding protein [Accumulibacter sp.]